MAGLADLAAFSRPIPAPGGVPWRTSRPPLVRKPAKPANGRLTMASLAPARRTRRLVEGWQAPGGEGRAVAGFRSRLAPRRRMLGGMADVTRLLDAAAAGDGAAGADRRDAGHGAVVHAR